MPPRRTTPKTFANAKALRRDLTPAEGKLWAYLRANRFEGIAFRRQHAIGPYVVDFCAPRHKLIIELDGSQHLDHEQYDADRSRFLNQRGYRVLRFWNHDVMERMEVVLEAIWHALHAPSE